MGTSIALPSATQTDAADLLCANATTQDLNNGLVCLYVGLGTPNERRVGFTTEDWDHRVRSWGELSTQFAAAEWPAKTGGARAIWFRNPSWHSVGDVWNGDPKWNAMSPSFTPPSLGAYHTGDTKLYVIDPTDGTRIHTTNVGDPNTVITSDGRTLVDIAYPNGQPPSSPISPANNVPDGGTIGGGTPIAGPLGTIPGTIPVLPPRVSSPIGDVRTLVNTAASAEPNASGGKWVLWVIGAAALFLVFGG